MLDIEQIKAEMVPMPGLIEVPRPGGPPALRSAEVDGLVMISRASVDALIAEVERLQGIINTALSLNKPNG